ncbi:MAG TPA: aldo/keto reductase [Mucilaginibacter sp.]|jgi:aryl-alcohol dehydrogenase-like predicted oxidoreductase|nr:aldo/keto reductase [Mucilaginibacter sp.]
MKYRTFAKNEKLSAIGLGCMSMSHAYGTPDDPESIRTLHLALDLGINFWDTADVYGNGKNEELISQVLPQNRDKIFIATKFGFRTDADARLTGFDARPAYIKQAVEASLKRLMTNTLKLAQLADNDFRKNLPRYQQEHQDNNEKLAAGFADIAKEKGCSPAQLALAWVLAQGDNIIPIPGTKKQDKLRDNAGSVDVVVTDEDKRNIEALLLKYPNIGDRYSEANKKFVDKS